MTRNYTSDSRAIAKQNVDTRDCGFPVGIRREVKIYIHIKSATSLLRDTANLELLEMEDGPISRTEILVSHTVCCEVLRDYRCLGTTDLFCHYNVSQ